MGKRMMVLHSPSRAPREVVECTSKYLFENDYILPLIEWVSTPAGGFLQGAEYRFALEQDGHWRVEKRQVRCNKWVYLFHAQTLERAIAYLWERGCGWWRPHSAHRLWREKVEIQELPEELSEPVEW